MSKEKELILEAIGKVSLCWEPKPTGVFETEKASKIADELEKSLLEA